MIVGIAKKEYAYSLTIILRCFVVRLWFRLDSNNLLPEFFEVNYRYNQKIMKACDLSQISDRRTFDRRLKIISTDIRTIITTMASLFLQEKNDRPIQWP